MNMQCQTTRDFTVCKPRDEEFNGTICHPEGQVHGGTSGRGHATESSSTCGRVKYSVDV